MSDSEARVRLNYLFLGILLYPVAAGGCLDAYEPDVGLLQSTACYNVDSEPDEPVSFREDIMLGIFEPLACLECHTPGGPTPIGIEVGGLDLSTHASMRRGGVNGGSSTVIPGQPCDSILFQKVGAGPSFGARMPIGGPPYLSENSLQLLHDWIAEGAKNN